MQDTQNKKPNIEAGNSAATEWLKRKNNLNKKPFQPIKQIRFPGARHRG